VQLRSASAGDKMKVCKKAACIGCSAVYEYTDDEIQISKGLYIGSQWCCAQDDEVIQFVECPECFLKAVV